MDIDNEVKTYNLAIIGDKEVGKSSFISRHTTGEFPKDYIPTQNIINNNDIKFNFPLEFRNKINFNIFDYPGDNQGGYENVDCAIIMFDVSNSQTYKNVKLWYNSIIQAKPNIPIVIVGNKVDRIDRCVKKTNIRFPKKHNLQYYDVSARSNYNFEKPFIYLSKILN
jgi:GTP-binding nuclear protein Ran